MMMNPFGARTLALALSTLALAGGASAQTIGPAIASYQAGVVCPSTGNDVASLPFVARTLVVPATQGVAFGVRALTTEAAGTVPAQVIVTHPPIAGSTQESYNLTLSPTQLAGFHYRFDRLDELVPGTWRVQAQSGGVVLFSIDFDVVLAGPDDGLLRACGS